MRRGLILAVALVWAAGTAALAQWTAGLGGYPGGYLLMKYRISVGGQEFTYTLELTPGDDGTYTIRTEVVGNAALEDVADPLLFFTWSPTIWFAESWWVPYYFMLGGFVGPPAPNKTYVIPGGPTFATEGYVTIAGVRAVKGILTSPATPGERVVLAISPDPAVPYPVLIRHERGAGGNWTVSEEMVLVEYAHRR